MKVIHIIGQEYDKVPIKILNKHSNYPNVFSFNLVMKLPKNKNINKYAIKLVEDKQPSYNPIHTLSLIELETLKTYIKAYLKTFIWLFKFLINVSILVKKKAWQ